MSFFSELSLAFLPLPPPSYASLLLALFPELLKELVYPQAEYASLLLLITSLLPLLTFPCVVTFLLPLLLQSHRDLLALLLPLPFPIISDLPLPPMKPFLPALNLLILLPLLNPLPLLSLLPLLSPLPLTLHPLRPLLPPTGLPAGGLLLPFLLTLPNLAKFLPLLPSLLLSLRPGPLSFCPPDQSWTSLPLWLPATLALPSLQSL